MTYTFDYQLTNLNKIIYSRQISCEIISPINSQNEEALICGYITFNKSILKYYYIAAVLNSLFNNIDSEINLLNKNQLYFYYQ